MSSEGKTEEKDQQHEPAQLYDMRLQVNARRNVLSFNRISGGWCAGSSNRVTFCSTLSVLICFYCIESMPFVLRSQGERVWFTAMSYWPLSPPLLSGRVCGHFSVYSGCCCIESLLRSLCWKCDGTALVFCSVVPISFCLFNLTL